MTKDEFMDVIRSEYPFDPPNKRATEVAEFIWNRWLWLYHEGYPVNPSKAWATKTTCHHVVQDAERTGMCVHCGRLVTWNRGAEAVTGEPGRWELL